MLLGIIGLDLMSDYYWMFVAANWIFFNLLSCLLVVSFDRYKMWVIWTSLIGVSWLY